MTQIPDRPKPNPKISQNRKILIGDLEPKNDRNSANLFSKKTLQSIVSIRSQLLWFAIPPLLLSLLLIGGSAYLIGKKNSAKQLDIQSKNQALLASKATSDLLKETLKLPKILAENPLILQAIAQGKEPNLGSDRTINNYLRNLAAIDKAQEISIVTLAGTNVATTLEQSEISAINSDWWKKAQKELNGSSNSYIQESSSPKNIDLIVPIKEPNNNRNFIGAIKYTIPSSKLLSIANYLMETGIEFLPTQRVQIVDNNTKNAILTVTRLGASSARKIIDEETVNQISEELIKLLKNLSQETIEKRKEVRIKDKQEDLSDRYSVNDLVIKYNNFNASQNRKQSELGELSKVGNRLNETSELILIASFKKDRKIYYISTIPGKINWLAIASIEESEIESAAKDANLTLLGSSAIVTVTALSVLFWLAKGLSLPLNRLAQTSEKIALGNLNLKADPKGGTTETKTIAQSFNKLVVQLNSLLAQQTYETKQSRLLAEISSCPSLNTKEAEITIERVIKKAREILTVQRIIIYRFKDDESGYISKEALIQPYPSSLNEESLKEPSIAKRIIEEYRQGKVVAIDDIKTAKLDPQDLQLMHKLAVKSSLTVPILTRGQLYGLLIGHHCEFTHNWQEKEIIFTKQLAAQLGLLLERVEFLEERREEAARSEYLKNITLKISGAIEAEDILETAVTESREVLKADRAIVYGFDGNRKGTVIAESVSEGWPQALGDEITDPGFINEFLDHYQQAGVKAISDIYQANLDEFHIKQIENYAVKAKLIAPILMGGELRGLLIAHQCSASRNWEKAEMDFLNQVSTQVGLALERANLLEQQREAREYLQERALELLREVDPLSKGDLTIRARVTEDEIGTVAYSYNSTIESLQRIVNQVKAASSRVATTTERNQVSVQALSSGAISQRQQIEAALQEIQAINSSIHAVAVNAEQAEAKVKQASQTVEEGEQAMNRTVEGIMNIQETVSATAEKVKQLGKSSQKISQVVNLISTFAAQTNLLALKTSLEAARAGEEGRGFAVIADEIRSLAAQSAQKSDEIEKLVANIQAETNEVVEAMEAGTSQVINGTELVEETRSSLEKISSFSNQINNLVEDIAKVALKQAQTSQAVTERIAEVAEISNQTSTEAEQVSESFQELLSVAHSLQDSIGQFKVA